MQPVPRPHPTRLDPARADYQVIVSAHETAVRRGETTYLDPTTGLVVLTVSAHLARGLCCQSRCRHCPYLQE